MSPFQVTDDEGFDDAMSEPEALYIWSSTGDSKVFLSRLGIDPSRTDIRQKRQLIIAFSDSFLMLVRTLMLFAIGE